MYNLAMKVSELGEFRLIDLLADAAARSKPAEASSWQQVLVGIGDDAAAWRSDASVQLATTDTLVQDVHFTLDTIAWEDLGWKALAVNLSDIAAMGAVPRYALLSLALPGDSEVEDMAALYRGMAKLANQFGVALVGGDIATAPLVVITVALWGNGLGGDDLMLTRSAAVPGDRIAVTGHLGSSAAGLKMLRQKLRFEPETTAFLKEAHLRPHPRVAEGQMLARHGVKAAIDISDGLIADLAHVCRASKVAARIRVDRVPVHPRLRASFKDDPLGLALSGGEDYELLFTARRGMIDRVEKAADCPISIIGEIVRGEPGTVTLTDEAGKAFDWQGRGWEHFVSTGD
ncbi:MAG: thiamine-phosphate kinase [Dehalococcoidia bacterium]